LSWCHTSSFISALSFSSLGRMSWRPLYKITSKYRCRRCQLTPYISHIKHKNYVVLVSIFFFTVSPFRERYYTPFTFVSPRLGLKSGEGHKLECFKWAASDIYCKFYENLVNLLCCKVLPVFSFPGYLYAYAEISMLKACSRCTVS
jgi:hypothetical protein